MALDPYCLGVKEGNIINKSYTALASSSTNVYVHALAMDVYEATVGGLYSVRL